MAVHNGGSFLDRSIRSIVKQTFTDWEMVIVDDASTDGSTELADRWAAQEPRIRVVANRQNKGQTSALNEGLALCRGTWVARQDADDISHPLRLREQMDYLANNPGTVLLGTQGILIDERGSLCGLLDVPCGKSAIDWSIPFLNPFLHTSVVFNREKVLAAGGYDKNYRIAQDYELWTRLAANNQTDNLRACLVRYRHTKTSLSQAGRDLASSEADRVSDREVRRFLGRPRTAHEEQLVSSFRRGLDPRLHGEFWSMIAAIEKETSHALPPLVRTTWLLRLAGTGGSRSKDALLKAFCCSPIFTLRWLVRRFLSF